MEKRRNGDVLLETVAVDGKQVVDVGCGEGHIVRLLTRHGAHVIGVECSPRQLVAAWAYPRVGDERIVSGVGQDLPVAADSADLVIFFNSLHHIPPDQMAVALAEAARVLRPGGLVYLSEPLPEGLFFETVRPIDDETAVRAQALATIERCDACGLALAGEIRYCHEVAMDSFASFRARVISANADREARFDVLDAEMRALFAANATPGPDGTFRFEQPMRVNLLRKPPA
ncbi:class I SAM-dependent methyltransferase [Magnetospirillum fulvum]|uniref:Methyltransferase domain-containing protein n=1 Tax=Magnetospirillum fulvum TaxID=1082 RepID=A0A1H6HX51_MAGFU|nr:class I SAM-dependent methyltransferase [Magnetospirillum fulvum]SEH40658.1 Methyltransferase domain-containing protein [Magnetospirillum fulvum]